METAEERILKHLKTHGADVPYPNRADLIEVAQKVKRARRYANGVELSEYMISLLRLENLL